MKQNNGTTIWIDKLHSKKLSKLAKQNHRSKAAQMRWMIDIEFLKIETGLVDVVKIDDDGEE